MPATNPPKKEKKHVPMTIRKETKDRLDNLGLPKAPYSTLLESLMDTYEEHKKCKKKK